MVPGGKLPLTFPPGLAFLLPLVQRLDLRLEVCIFCPTLGVGSFFCIFQGFLILPDSQVCTRL